MQFTALMEVLHDMLDQIERQRLSKMANEIPDEVDLPTRWAPPIEFFSNQIFDHFDVF